MAALCPAPGPTDPVVQGLLGVVDCNVQTLVQSGYETLFSEGGPLGGALNSVLVIYVAFVGYRLLLGRGRLDVSDTAIAALKLGVILALTTQWSLYETVVYKVLFEGPQELAAVILSTLRAKGSVLPGDVFQGLDRALQDLTAFSPAAPPGGPGALASPAAAALAPNGAGQISTLLSRSGFDALLLLGSALLLLLATLGVLLAAKIVLGLLLAAGPLFLACLLFDATRGLFVGWMRAAIAFAFAGFAVVVLLAVALTLLEPSLRQLEDMKVSSTYTPGVAFTVAALTAVTVLVAMGLTAAGAILSLGFRLPESLSAGARTSAPATALGGAAGASAAAPRERSDRTVDAVMAMRRRDLAEPVSQSLIGAGAAERRIEMRVTATQALPDVAIDRRLGQQPRRRAEPRKRTAAPADAARRG
jgi:type IV secretion system protein VirB6